MKKKRPFFLLEILVGLALISMLFVLLFSALRQNLSWNEKIEPVRRRLLERQICSARLQDFFLSVRKGSLYTWEQPDEAASRLIAVIDHGLDPDPLFSGPVLAQIYLDGDRTLKLALWPLHTKTKQKPWRTETLMTDVEGIRWSFLHRNLIEKQSVAKGSQEEPLLIRFYIQQEKQSLSFAFFPICPEQIALYRGVS